MFKTFIKKILNSFALGRKLLYYRNFVWPVVGPLVFARIRNPRLIYWLMTPVHTNLGDQAITIAEKQLFERHKIKVMEVHGALLRELKELKYLWIFNGCTLFIHGGGFLGTLWPEEEYLFREIIKQNPKSKIICFPQTVFYDNSDYGKQELETSQKIYNAHRNLRIYAREKISYAFAKELYTDVRLCPDMVLGLKKDRNQQERKGCLLCLRNDVEKTCSASDEQQITLQVEMLFGKNYSSTDMLEPEPFPLSDREYVLEKKFAQFKSAELVITDRLHGMIFCAVTGTPCIVISSKSHKVQGCYEWIQHLPYIRFADSPEMISKEYAEIPRKHFQYDNTPFMQCYDQLIQESKS